MPGGFFFRPASGKEGNEASISWSKTWKTILDTVLIKSYYTLLFIGTFLEFTNRLNLILPSVNQPFHITLFAMLDCDKDTKDVAKRCFSIGFFTNIQEL